MKWLMRLALCAALGSLLGYAAFPVHSQPGYRRGMVASSGSGTAGAIPKFVTATELADSILSEDGTNVTLASGQLLLPDGAVGAPSLGWTSDNDGSGTGIYRPAANRVGVSANGALQVQHTATTTDIWNLTTLTATNAAGAGADLVTISSTLGIMDGSDTVRGLFVDLTNADHTGSGNSVYGLSFGAFSADAHANEFAIHIGSGWDYGLQIGQATSAAISLAGGNNYEHIQYATHGTFGDGTRTGAHALSLFPFPDAVADFADTYMVGVGDGTDTIAAMDGSDTYAMLKIDFTNADHTGASNTLVGLDIDTIVGDADASEYGLRIGSGWDQNIFFADAATSVAFSDGGTFRIRDANSQTDLWIRDAADSSADYVHIDVEQVAVSGSGSPTAFLVDVTNANHTGTGNVLNLIQTAAITGDANANLNAINIGALTGTSGAAGELEYAIQSEGGWDAFLRDVGVAFANLQNADNGSITYCTDCDPNVSPCASAAGQTGAWAFRQNGAWECPF